jgi:mono/diheme cytochrome c family protein
MKILKVIGILLLALLLLGVAGGSWVWWRSSSLLRARHDVPAVNVPVPGDSVSLARGRHLATALSKCTECHGEGLGGRVAFDALPFARVVAPNLTTGRGGIGGARSDAELMAAIRHGVGPGGRGLIVMPAEAFIHLSDADLGALVAYLRTLPPLDSDLQPIVIGPLGRVLLAAGKAPIIPAAMIDHARVAPYVADPGATIEYGRYLSWIGGCHACHGENLSGRPSFGPDEPVSANITPGGLPDWTEEEFRTLLRDGRGRGGREIDNDFMPWRPTGLMSEMEIRALYLYLRSVPAKEFNEL